jgi:hypothetical protein
MALRSQIDAAARKEKRPVGAGRLLDDHAIAGVGQTYGIDDDDRDAAEIALRRMANRHDCKAPALIRKAVAAGQGDFAADVQANPARYCGDPRHNDDAEALAEALQALGLRDTPPTRTPTPRGRCPVCGRRRELRADGTLASHGACEGAGRRPVKE